MATASEDVVVDASVLLALVLPDTPERERQAQALLTDAGTGRCRLFVPQVCHLELAGVLARKVRSNMLDDAVAREFFDLIDGMSLDLLVESFSAAEAYELAMTFGCQVADAIYVRMAIDQPASLATLDGGQATAARAADVSLYFDTVKA